MGPTGSGKTTVCQPIDLTDESLTQNVLTVRQLSIGVITWRGAWIGELHFRSTNNLSVQRRRKTSGFDRYTGFWRHYLIGQRHMEDYSCILRH
jgi:hypothetical protein